MTDRQTKEDSASSEERVVARITKAFGIKVHLAEQLFDEYGERYVTAACNKVEDDIAAGASFRSPAGILISVLRSGEIQAMLARQDAQETAVDAEVEWLRWRYENAQADPNRDTAAKRLGYGITLPQLAESAAKKGFVMLDCGHFVPRPDGRPSGRIAGSRCRCEAEFIATVSRRG